MKKIKDMFEKHDLLKALLIVILLTVILSWIIPYGYFSGNNLTDYGLGRQGLVDISLAGVYSFNFFIQQVLVVIFIGIFYGIISKTNGYKGLVSKIADIFKGKEKVFVLLSSLLMTLLTTFLTQSFVVFIFVPLVISIVSKLNLDKITAFLCTFGSIVIGILGATYGTDGLNYFVTYLNYYKSVELTLEIGLRFGILALAFVVFNVFTLKHVNKVLASKKNEDKIEDMFMVENAPKKTKIWPMGLFFMVLFIFAILGYINWSETFKITAFDNFHTWLTGLKIGDHAIISYILGNNATAFGKWDLYVITLIMGIIILLSKVIYKIKLDDLIDNALDGLRKMIKPVALLLLIYVVFVFIYWAPFTATISSWILKLTEGFNPFLTAIASFISSIFQADFGFTGYLMGDFMASHFGESFNIGYVIYITINGLVQMIAPTSVFAVLGLSYLDIPYKKWLKYIWKFFVIMLVLLLGIFALLTYL